MDFTPDNVGEYRLIGLARNQYGKVNCYNAVQVKKKALKCSTEVVNLSPWYTRFDFFNRRTKKRVFNTTKTLYPNYGVSVESQDGYDYLGLFWDSYNGYWLKKVVKLKACGSYFVKAINGVQKIVKQK